MTVTAETDGDAKKPQTPGLGQDLLDNHSTTVEIAAEGQYRPIDRQQRNLTIRAMR